MQSLAFAYRLYSTTILYVNNSSPSRERYGMFKYLEIIYDNTTTSQSKKAKA